ncbi:MAG: cysteine peptidase family C39 domain-containing protein [Planctomycetota bacterium]
MLTHRHSGRTVAAVLTLICAHAGAAVAAPPVRDADRNISVGVASYKSLRERNVVMQRQDYTCGAASVATVARYFWRDDVTETDVLAAVAAVLSPAEWSDRVRNGLAITDLRDAAGELGYDGLVTDLTFSELVGSKVPLIVPITVNGHDHFAVYRGYDGRYVYVADPLRGNVRTQTARFLVQWKTRAALVIDNPAKDIPRASLLSVTGREVRRGFTNDQLIRGVLTQPATPRQR